MALIRHTISTGLEFDKSADEAAEMVRVCGREATTHPYDKVEDGIHYWRDQHAGKILQFATITLGNSCGKIVVAYADPRKARQVARQIAGL